MTRTVFVLCVVAGLVLGLGGGAYGQPASCFGDDGFNVGCCASPMPNLPNFPAVNVAGSYVCIEDCDAGPSRLVNVTLGPPQMVLCDYALIHINVTPNGPGGPQFGGVLVGKYARTWVEHPIGTNIVRQVWRFILNGDVDFGLTSIGSGTCPVPPCAVPPNNLPVHMIGSIDYAMDCPSTGVNAWSIAMNLTHVKGCLFHAPFSQRPLAGAAGHSNISYTLVAPPNFVFTVANAAAPVGGFTAESVRSSALSFNPFHYDCHGEAPVIQGNLQTNNAACYSCSSIAPIGVPRWRFQTVQGTTACSVLGPPTPFQSLPVPPIFPTGLQAMALGEYVGINATQFAVGRRIVLYFGLMSYPSPCSPSSRSPVHAVTGVGHTSVHPATLFTPLPFISPVSRFVDLVNMFPLSANVGPVTTPSPTLGIGSLFASSVVWSLNPQ